MHMTNGKQIQMVMRDMLFITWAVEPEVLRDKVNSKLSLDTRADSSGRPRAFVSAVCFRVDEMRSSVLSLPRVSFEQVNYRAYSTGDGTPSVCFLDMRVNSRLVATLTGFLRVPISYEDIAINTTSAGSQLYTFDSPGLRVRAVVGEQHNAGADPPISSDFITHRLVGYAAAGDNVFKIEVEHARMETRAARIEDVRAPRLEQIGLLTGEQSAHPHSALYVRESVFGTNPPARAW